MELEKYWLGMFHCFPAVNMESNGIFPTREIVPQKRWDLEKPSEILLFQIAAFWIGDGGERQD